MTPNNKKTPVRCSLENLKKDLIVSKIIKRHFTKPKNMKYFTIKYFLNKIISIYQKSTLLKKYRFLCL